MVLEFETARRGREQLQTVLELSSKHPQARAMLFTMDQAAAVAAQHQRDPEVKQTAADATHPLEQPWRSSTRP